MLLELIGEEMLAEIASEAVDLLQTSSVIFEKNGTVAASQFSSTWCRFLDAASQKFCGTHELCHTDNCNIWQCQAFWWNAAGQQAIATGKPTDVDCPGGVRVYALPICAGSEAVGSIAFSYGDPPRDEQTLRRIAEQYEVNLEELRTAGQGYQSRPPQIVEAAKRRLHTTARLIGEIVVRKRAEQSEQVARATAEAASHQIENLIRSIADAFFALDRDWRVTYVGPKAARLLRRPRAELIGRRLCDEFSEQEQEQLGFDKFFEKFAVVMRQRIPLEFEYSPGPEQWLELRVFPAEEGGIAVIGRDISDRKRLALELELSQAESRKRQEFLQEFVQHAPVAVAMFDRNMRYVLVTDRWLADHKRTREEVIGRCHYEVFPGVPERWKGVHQRVLATGKAERCEEDCVQRRDGSMWWLKWETRRWGDEGEDTGGIFIATEDITERKLAQEALIRSEKLASVGRMAATIAHEINNPLAAVMNAVYLAWLDPEISDQVRSSLDLAQQELDRISHITKQTLGFYRETRAPSLVEMTEVAENVLQLYGPKLKNKNINVKTRYSPRAAVLGTAGELRQVLSNLVANGIDAVPQQGTIQVRVRPVSVNGHAPAVRVTVADNGGGIAFQDLKKIFEPFFTTKRSFGTGLGLWVTKEILKKHGGSIRVRSRLGAGTVFTVCLPRGNPDSTTAGAA